MTGRFVAVVRVNAHCDLACPFCAYDRTRDIERGQLDAPRVLSLAETLFHRHGKPSPPLISFLGGEPFAWKPLLATVRQCRALGLSVSVTSNGSLLGRRIEDAFQFDEITLSLDAPGELHDRLRGDQGLFDRVLALLQGVGQGRGRDGKGSPLLRVNTVLTEATIALFPELCHILSETPVDEITFNLLGGRDRPEYYQTHKVTAATWANFMEGLPKIRDHLAQNGVRLLASPEYLDRLGDRVHGVRRPITDCHPGGNFLFVNERGRVSPCAFTEGETGWAIEDYCKDDPKEQWRERQHGHPWSACADCPSTQVFGKFQSSRYNEVNHGT